MSDVSEGTLLPEIFDSGADTPPIGDAALYARAEEIRSGYSCPHTSDSFYLALTEEFAKSGPAEFLTFDKRVVNVAAKNAPTVKVNLLPS